jgi:hypothetical protein
MGLARPLSHLRKIGDSPRLSVRYDGHDTDRSVRARHGISIGNKLPLAFPVPGRVAARELTPLRFP